MNPTKVIFLAVALLILLGGGLYLYNKKPPVDKPLPAVAQSEETEVRAAVVRFAEELKTVPLGATDDILRKAIEDNYGPLISADLLAAWQKEPNKAPGRLAEGPAPEGVKIAVFDRDSEDGSYIVEGDVISGETAQYQVAMKFRKQADGRWLIVGFVAAIPSGT